MIVPGIVSHLWISGHAGEATDCSATGLHQPFSQLPVPELCVPGAGATSNPIRDIHRFDIHLPRDPREILAPYKDAPPVPLYIETFTVVGSGGPAPVITQDAEHPNVLHVTVDLTNFSGLAYGRKIVAAWALPSPNNWGLKRWRVAIDKLNVRNDADGIWRGDGDWKFWANINNTNQEWTRIFDCYGCVHGTENFGGTPFRTGNSVPASHSLGDDVQLFPGQKIWLMTSGYDSDWLWGDATGDVALALRQTPVTNGVRRSWCRSSTTSGCGSYDLHYRVEEVASEVLAELTPLGQTLSKDYRVDLGDVNDARFEILYAQGWGLPDDVVVAPGQAPASFDLGDFAMQQGPEPSNLNEVSGPEQLAEVFELLQNENPEHFDRYLTEMHEEALEALDGDAAEDTRADLLALKLVFPEEIWEQYFGDIDLAVP